MFILYFLIVSFGCGASQEQAKDSLSSEQSDEAYVTNADMNQIAGEGTGHDSALLSENKIIYRSEITIETEKFESATESIENEVKEIGGYIESSSIRGRGLDEEDPRYGNYVLRIPESEFTSFKNIAKNWGNIISINTDSEDVSTQYYDLKTRMETLNIQEERLLELLKKADRMEDMIALERELQDVRYQIENHTSTVKKLDELINYSTITIHVREVERLSIVPKSFGEEILESIKASAKSFVEVSQNIIITLIYLIPYLVVAVIIILLIRKKVSGFSKISLPWRKHKKQ